ncbi:MAG: hypothetical protein PHZ09_09885, partial [Eubacteriales bacterium]|nr:hypothetical protein [Eubacteriales bacterium]
MQKILKRIVDYTKNKITQYEFKLNARRHPQDLDEIGKTNMHYSKQAFCQNRKKIRYEAIEEFFITSVGGWHGGHSLRDYIP